jgi:hypothetical protein
MSFKSIFMSSVLIISLTGCSWWGGDISDNTVIKLDEREVLGNSTSCIDELGSFFSNYFSGHTTENEINRHFGCVLETVDVIFENATEKDQNKGFTRKEIHQILTTIFPKKDEDFLEDNIEILFLVKRIFVGGGLDGFTRVDHLNLKAVLPEVKTEFIKSRKSIKHLFLGAKLSFDERNEAFEQLSVSFKTLDKIKMDNSGEITESEGNALVEYIFKSETLLQFKDIAYVAKTFVFNDDPKTFLKSQEDFFERLILVFEVQSRLRALNFNQGLLFGKSYYDLETSVLLTSKSLLKWASLDKSWYIHVESFSSMLKAITAAGFWTDKFTDPELVSSSVQKMLTQIFEKEKLDKSSMERLDGIFKDWVNRQENIISKFNFSWIIKKKISDIGAESQNIVDEVETFKFPQFVSELNAPIVINREGSSFVPAEQYFDQSLKHLLISAANEVFKAYSAVQPFTRGASNVRITLTLSDLTRIFQDIRPLGLEFGFNDPHHCGSEKRVMIEADSLTLSGNGDNKVSIRESVEWLATMISVASVSDQAFARIEESCSLPGMKVLGAPFLDRSCALKQLTGNDQILLRHFKGTSHYVDMLKSDTRRADFESKLGGLVDWVGGVEYKKETHVEFLKNRYNSSNTCIENDDFPFSKREFNTAFAINIYVENLYHQFDKSGVDSWWPGTTDPGGADFIIDGIELSNFLKSKASSMIDVLVPIYKKKSFWTRHLSDKQVKGLLRNLPENTNYMDRSRSFQLLNMFLNAAEPQARHPMQNKFCEDVSRSQESDIFYEKEDRRMCLPGDGE